RIYQQTFGSKSSSQTMADEFEYESLRRMFNETSLAERIKVNQLNNFIKVGLADKDIKDEFTYGVYSLTAKSFVILNGYYAVESFNKNVYHSSMDKGLFNTNFKVSIFNDSGSLEHGLLMIYFPNRSYFEPIWWIIISSAIFTAIILFTFIFTIYEILRQKKLSNMKNDFINNMTHEFKTPIATISLATDSIKNVNIISNPDKIMRFLGIIKQENNRMLNQVEKVLQMALIDRQKLKLNISDLHLHDIIKTAVEHINLQVEQKNGYIETFYEADPDVIQGDVTHISSMVHNLLDNANKYSPEYPELTVTTKNTAEGIDIIVSDKGIGMSKDQKKHIFDKFYRATSGNLHDVKGFGLGLSYVKAMMAAHKGSVDVKTELGKGSTFTLSFPYKQQNDD
ncbi:MAG: HAMP domain-containing sensor histidine kinase, partial [Saprospiraceae bacterium]